MLCLLGPYQHCRCVETSGRFFRTHKFFVSWKDLKMQDRILRFLVFMQGLNVKNVCRVSVIIKCYSYQRGYTCYGEI